MGLVAEYWTHVYDFFGGDEFWMTVIGSWCVFVGTIWTLNLFLLPVDLTGKPEWIVRYKVQSNNAEPVDPKKVWGAIKTVLFNQFVVSLPLGFVIYYLSPPGSCHPDNIPSGWIVLRDMAVSVLCVEVAFYYTHRLIHYGPLYRSIHKKHHEWQAPIGIVATYAHPVEFVAGNVLPVVIGPLLMRSHMLTMWLWLVIALMETTTTHSGYHLPFVLKSPQFHDFHHLKFTGNYGALGLLDWLHGTDLVFRESIQLQRNKINFSLTPMDVLYPDKKSKSTKSG